MLGAYLDAWSHVQAVDPLAPWQDAVVVGGWLALIAERLTDLSEPAVRLE
jgi:hypothetical protein